MMIPGFQNRKSYVRFALRLQQHFRGVMLRAYCTKKNVDRVRRTYATLTGYGVGVETLVFTGLRLAQTVLYLEAYPGHAVPRN